MDEWFATLDLHEFIEVFCEHGFEQIMDFDDLTVEDLEEIPSTENQDE